MSLASTSAYGPKPRFQHAESAHPTPSAIDTVGQRESLGPSLQAVKGPYRPCPRSRDCAACADRPVRVALDSQEIEKANDERLRPEIDRRACLPSRQTMQARMATPQIR